MKFTSTLSFQSFVSLLCIFGAIGGTDAEDDAPYTKEEQLALAKFRPLVESILLKDYMRTDQYLIPWLRVKNLDVQEAKRMLASSMEWRKENKMGTILQEDFSRYRKQYPVIGEGFDKDGRPVITYLFGFYDFRKIALAGEMPHFQRYLARVLEEIHRRLREDTPRNVTQGFSIFDLHGFNTRQHLCLQCLTVYPYFVNLYENHYPYMGYKTYLVNTPTIFERVLQIIRPLMSEYTRNTLYVLALNKDEWSHLLLDQIPKDELLIQFGGSKKVKAGMGI